MNNGTGENEEIVSFESWIELIDIEQRSFTCYFELRAHKERWSIDRNIMENLVDRQGAVFEFESITFHTFELYVRDVGNLTRQLTEKFVETLLV